MCGKEAGDGEVKFEFRVLSHEYFFVDGLAEFFECFVLDLADAFLGDADDLADFFEGHGGGWRDGVVAVDGEASLDDGFFDVGELGAVLADDAMELFDGVLLDVGPADFLVI